MPSAALTAHTLQIDPLSLAVCGEYTPPADLPAARVALLCALLSSGPIVLRGELGSSLDPLLRALSAFGAQVGQSEGSLSIDPPRILLAPAAPLDLGDCEESLLLVAGLACGAGLSLSAVADSAQPEVLMAACELLSRLGGAVSCESSGGRVEIRVQPGSAAAAILELPAQPLQLNAVLLIAALAGGVELTLRETRGCYDHAYRLLRSLGIEMYQTPDGMSLPGGQRPLGGEIKLPGSPDDAAARLIPALLLPGSDLSVSQVSMNPRRSGLLKLLHESCPAQREGQPGIARTRSWQFGHEPVAALRAVYTSRLRSIIVLPNRAALLGPELPWLLLLAAQGRGSSTLRGFERSLPGFGSLRQGYLAEILRAFGVDAELDSDGWRISGPTQLLGAEVQCAGDPLLTACAQTLARFADGPSTLYAAAAAADPLAALAV